MRTLLTACTAIAVLSLAAALPARAETMHAAGGPIASGASCWKSTNGDLGYGYWEACPKAARPMKMKKKG